MHPFKCDVHIFYLKLLYYFNFKLFLCELSICNNSTDEVAIQIYESVHTYIYY